MTFLYSRLVKVICFTEFPDAHMVNTARASHLDYSKMSLSFSRSSFVARDNNLYDNVIFGFTDGDNCSSLAVAEQVRGDRVQEALRFMPLVNEGQRVAAFLYEVLYSQFQDDEPVTIRVEESGAWAATTPSMPADFTRELSLFPFNCNVCDSHFP